MTRKTARASAITVAACLCCFGMLGSQVAAAKDSNGHAGGPPLSHGDLGGGAGAGHGRGHGSDGPAVTGNSGSGTGSVRSDSTDAGGDSASTVGPSTGPHGKGSKKGAGAALSGSPTCSIHGKVSFNPPLKTGGSVASKVMVTGLLNVCSAASSGGARFNNGHLSALVGTLSANDCASLGSGTAPLISGGSIKWTPPSKVAMSTGISMPTGTGSVVTSGAKPHIQVVYSGGSIAGGSFSNSGATSLTMTSDQDSAQIQSRCTTGLSSVAFKGTATL